MIQTKWRQKGRQALALILSIGLTLGLAKLPQVEAQPASAPLALIESRLQELQRQLDGFDSAQSGYHLESSQNPIPVYIQLHQRTTQSGLSPNLNLQLRDQAGMNRQVAYAQALHAEFLASLSSELGHTLQPNEEIFLVDNALALEVTGAELKTLVAHPDVRNIQLDLPVFTRPELPSPENKPKSRSRRDLSEAYDPDSIQGAGSVIAILDSGFQVDHEGMAAPKDKAAMRYNEQSMQAKISSAPEPLKGKFFNEKFPYGYNYADGDQDLFEEGMSHGTHVAGIAAGTGDAAGKYVGQAPQAQVLAMRVFSKTGAKGTRAGIYNKALDDSIYLQADVINMSLGSDFGTLNTVDQATLAAIEKAKSIGTVFSISAGNASYANEGLPITANNPWISTLGSPAIAPSALAVASINGMEKVSPVLEVEGSEAIPYQPSKTVPVDTLYGTKLPMGDAGRAKPDQDHPVWDAVDLQEKAALIERGDNTFVEKVNNAAEKGAKLAIIYNSEEGGENFVGMALDGTKIPAISLKRSDGLKLLELLKKNPGQTITVTKGVGGYPYEDAGKMSNFSSWGPSPEFDLKPEITAVGGEVYAPQPGNTYDNMSGTSMAAPQIAGMIALLHERFAKDDRITLPGASEGEARFQLIRNLMMSTAVPHKRSEQPVAFDSPRKQGAGVATRENFLTSQAYASAVPTSDVSLADAKLNLGAMNEAEFDLTFVVHNISKTETLTFVPSATVQTDQLKDNPAFIEVGGVQDIIPPVSAAPVTIKPGAAETVTLHISVPEDRHKDLLSHFINGYYMEGFVRLTSQTSGQCDLGLPWISFRSNESGKGQGGIPALETPIYDPYWNLQDAPKPKFYDTQSTEPGKGSDPNPFTALVTTVNGKTVVAGETTAPGAKVRTFDDKKIFITPNGDGKNDSIGLSGIFQFSVFEIYSRVVDAQGEEVFKSGAEGTLDNPISQSNYDKNDLEKPFFNVPAHASTWDWNGLKDGKPLPDGTYTYELHLKSTSEAKPGLAAEKIPEQVTRFQVQLDATGPDLKDISFENGMYQGTVVETGSGMGTAKLVLKGKDGAADQEVPVELDADGHLRANLPAEADLFQYELTLIDQAGNETRINLGLSLLKEFASIEVKFQDTNGKPVEVQDGEIILQAADSKGHTFTDLKKLPYGVIEVSAKSNVPRLVVQNSPQKTELSATNQKATITFTVKVFEVRSVEIGINYEPRGVGSTFPGEPKLKATNKESKQEVSFKYGSFFGLLYFFSADLTDGTWTLSLDELPDGWWTPFKDTEIEVSENMSEISIRIVKGPKTAIEPQTIVESGDLDPATVRYQAYNGMDYYEDLSQLAEGPYLVFPVMTEELAATYYVTPDHAAVKTEAGKVQKPEFRFNKLTEETYGKVVVETKMEDGSAPIEVTYIAESLLGYRSRELGHIPYGEWYIQPDVYDPKYVVVSEEIQKIQVNKENPEVHLTFTFARASSMDKKGSLSILPMWESYREQLGYEGQHEEYNFILKNMDTGKEETYSSKPSFLGMTLKDIPFGYYKVTPVVDLPYYTLPESAYVRVVSEKDAAKVSFQYRYLADGAEKPAPEAPWKQTVETEAGPVTLEIPASFKPKLEDGEELQLLATALKSEEIQALKEKSETFKDFTNEQKALSLFDVKLVAHSEKGDRPIVNRNLPIGFQATLTLPATEKAFSEYQVQSFYLTPDGDVFEKKEAPVQDQKVQLEIRHLSFYGLMASGNKLNPNPDEGKEPGKPGSGTPVDSGDDSGAGYFKPLLPTKSQPNLEAKSVGSEKLENAGRALSAQTQTSKTASSRDSVPATGESANERVASGALLIAALLAMGMFVARRRKRSER